MADYNIQMSYLNSEGGYDNLNPVTLLNNISDWANYIYSKTEVDSQIDSNGLKVGHYTYKGMGLAMLSGTLTFPYFPENFIILKADSQVIAWGNRYYNYIFVLQKDQGMMLTSGNWSDMNYNYVMEGVINYLNDNKTNYDVFYFYF